MSWILHRRYSDSRLDENAKLYSHATPVCPLEGRVDWLAAGGEEQVEVVWSNVLETLACCTRIIGSIDRLQLLSLSSVHC